MKLKFNKIFVVSLLFLFLFSGLAIAGPGETLSKVFDSILDFADVNDILNDHTNKLPALLRVLIGIAIFSLLYMGSKYIPVLKDDSNKNIRMTLTIIISIISGIFIPNEVLLISGSNFGLLFSALLVFGPVGGVMILLLKSETNSKLSAGIKLFVTMLLLGMIGVVSSWTQELGHLHSNPNFVSEFAGWVELILVVIGAWFFIKIFGNYGGSSSSSDSGNSGSWFGSSDPEPSPSGPSSPNRGYPSNSSGDGSKGKEPSDKTENLEKAEESLTIEELGFIKKAHDGLSKLSLDFEKLKPDFKSSKDTDNKTLNNKIDVLIAEVQLLVEKPLKEVEGLSKKTQRLARTLKKRITHELDRPDFTDKETKIFAIAQDIKKEVHALIKDKVKKIETNLKKLKDKPKGDNTYNLNSFNSANLSLKGISNSIKKVYEEISMLIKLEQDLDKEISKLKK